MSDRRVQPTPGVSAPSSLHKVPGRIAFVATAIATGALLLAGMLPTAPQHTPWECIGGCGAGGSGGSSASSARWIGRGVSGGLLDMQAMYASSATRSSLTRSLEARLGFKPTYTTALSLTAPFLSKSGTMQTSTASDEIPGLMNNGLGDLRIDWQKNFGLQGEFSLNLTLGLPTGNYSTSTGATNKKRYLPTSLQLGSGLCNAAIDIGYLMDRDDAMFLFDLVYSHPFAVNFSGKNRFISSQADHYQQLARDEVWQLLSGKEKRRHAYYVKPYGENDLGLYTPPSLSLSAFYAYKELRTMVHSAGLQLGVPLGVGWIPDFDCKRYDPKPDPDHQAWNVTLCYGLEFSRPTVPVFLALYVPIHDKTASATDAQLVDPYDPTPMAQWNGPDWNDVLRRWSLFVGVKASCF